MPRLAFFSGEHVPQPQRVEQTRKQRTQYHNSDCPSVPPSSLLATWTDPMCFVCFGGLSYQEYGLWYFYTPQCEPSHLVNSQSLERLGNVLASSQTTRALLLYLFPVNSTAGAPSALCDWQGCAQGLGTQENNHKARMATPEGSNY